MCQQVYRLEQSAGKQADTNWLVASLFIVAVPAL
jgi:hypothetical protein